MAIAIYTRYSTEMQSPHSCEDQERNVRRLFDRLGIDHRQAEVFHDRAESGTKTDRPQYQAMLAKVERGEFTVLGADEQSRLTRDDNAIGIIKDLIFHGVRFVAGDGVDTKDKDWKMRGQLIGINNSNTIDLTADRVRRGMSGRVERGLSAGDLPFGYCSEYADPEYALRYVGKGPKPEKLVLIHEVHADIVRQIFTSFAAGKSLTQIANQLETDGAPRGPRVKRWSAKLVRRILGNEKYRGHWTYCVTTFIRDSKGRKKQVPGPAADVIHTERPELAIITPELDQRVRTQLAKLNQLYGQKPGQKRRGPLVHPTVAYPQRLLLHVLRCEECGSKLHHISHRATTPAMRRCKSYGVGCSARTQVPANEARRTILEFFATLLRDVPGWLDEVLRSAHEHLRGAQTTASTQLAALNANLRDLDRRRDNLLHLVEEGTLDVALIAERIAKLATDKQEAEQRLRDAEALCALENASCDPEWLRGQLVELASLIEADEAQASRLIGQFVGTIKVRHLRPEGGRVGGQQYLVFRIQPWQTLLAALEGRLPAEVTRYLSGEPDLTGAVSPEFCLPVLKTDRLEDVLPQILAMRAEGASYLAIARATNLSWYKVKQACRREAERQRLIDESRGDAA